MQHQENKSATEGASEFKHFWQRNKDSTWSSVEEAKIDATRKAGKARYTTILSTNYAEGCKDPHYRGPFYLDVDVKPEAGGIPIAIRQTRTLCENLEGLGVSLDQCRLFASGSKGFHVEVPSEVFRIGGDPDDGTACLPLIYRNLALQVFVDGLDMAVYSSSRGRQWRVPNVQRENGRYKVPITVDDLRTMTASDYETLIAAPRPEVPAKAPTLAPGLAAKFAAEASRVKQIAAHKAEVKRVDPATFASLPAGKQAIEVVKKEASKAVHTLVSEWLAGHGEWHGEYFEARNPQRPDDRKGGSFIVYGNGSWLDFASELDDEGKHTIRGSDLVALYAYLFHDGRQEEAARAIAGAHGIDIEARRAETIGEARAAEFDAIENVPDASVRGGFMAESAASLMAAEFKPKRAVVEGLLFEGVTLLVGAPKVGKSWLALDVALAVAGGVPTIGGRSVYGGPVLYLSPDDGNRRRMQERVTAVTIARKAEAGLDRLSLVFEIPRVGSGFAEAFRAHLEAMPVPPALVVVDTLNRLLPAAGRVSNQYLHEAEAMGAVKRLADAFGTAILVLHHDRKAEGADKLDGVSGTKAITGGVDAIWMMKRLAVGNAKGASLDITGRDCEEMTLGLAFDTDKRVWTDDGRGPDELKAGESRQAILNVLRGQGAEGALRRPEVPHLSVKEIAQALGEKANTVAKLVRRLLDDQIIVQQAKGRALAYAIV